MHTQLYTTWSTNHKKSRLAAEDHYWLEGAACVIFDEFHERSLDADLSLALTAEVREALRPDLRLVVMSATLVGDGPDYVPFELPFRVH